MSQNEKNLVENLQKTLSSARPFKDNLQESSNVVPQQNPVAQATNIGSKFKSVEDLAKAYQELERKYGVQSRELGELRLVADEYFAHKQNCERMQKQLEEFQQFIQAMPEKYHSDNYLKNKEFRNILKSAYEGFGNKLDVDSLVDLLEKYLAARASIAKKADSISSEAASATDLLGYATNGYSKFKGPKKRLSDMTPEELDKALDELM